MKISIWEHIKEDFSMPIKNDPAFFSKIELFFNYPGIWAIANYRIANYFYINNFKRLARFLSGISQFFTSVDIHPGCQIGRRVFLDHAVGIVIGETTIVGNDVLIYQGVTLGGVNLDKGIKRHPTLKDGVVVGSGAKILGDIIIGNNCRIGSNSVVIKSVPDNSTAVGIPARIIGEKKEKNKLEHNKIPDINKEMFIYLIKRIEILEEALIKEDIKIEQKDKELKEVYKKFIKAME